MKKIVAKSKVFKIYTDQVRRGETSIEFEYATLFDDTTESVMVAAKNEIGQFILVEQYWAASNKKGLIFPGGKIEKKESPEEAAKRELAEETGFWSENLEKITTVDILPKYLNAKTHFFIADNLKPTTEYKGDEKFEMKNILLDLKELKDKIIKNELSDSRTLSLALLIIAQNDYD